MAGKGAKLIDLSGKKFGRLLVLKRGEDRGIQPHWVCQCDCGGLAEVAGGKLRGGKTRSCGCLIDEARKKLLTTHGLSRTRAYACHHNMMTRCYDPTCDSYERYGAAGVKVAEAWHDPAKFCADMGECPEGLTLDRIDNSKGYEPGNCRWATRIEQAKNRKFKKAAK